MNTTSTPGISLSLSLHTYKTEQQNIEGIDKQEWNKLVVTL